MSLSGVLAFCQNLQNAWKLGNTASQESPKWKDKKVEIVPLNSQVFSSSFTYFNRFYNIFRVAVGSVTHSWYLYQHGFFALAEKELSIGDGRYHAICQIPLLSGNLVLVTDPNVMREILEHERNETTPDGFFLGGIPTEVSQKILGDNLLSYSADIHSQFRKIIAPHFSHVRQHLSTMQNILEMRINTWPINDQPCEISPWLPPLIVEAVNRCFLGYEGPFLKITQAIETLLQLVTKERKTAEEQCEFDNAIDLIETCAHQVAENKKKNKLLQDVPEDQLLAFIKIMFFAGQDTTSALIEYLMLTLGQDEFKIWQKTLYQKWDQSNSSLTEFIQNSKELEWIIKEALRLHPPSFEQTRYVRQDLLIDNRHIIPRNSELHLFHFYSQRDSQRWGEDAQTFNPLRYQEENQKQAIYPFSAGKTICIGKQFANNLAKLFVMTMIINFEWRSLSTIEKLEGSVALKIVPTPRFVFTRRNAGESYHASNG